MLVPSSKRPFICRACHLPNVSSAERVTGRPAAAGMRRGQRSPRLHHPGTGRFALAVVVIRSAPPLHISSGLGSPLTVYAGYQAAHPYAPGRDLILIDQRATGRSEPDLCPDLREAMVDALAAVTAGSEAETRARRHCVFLACRTQAMAMAAGIDFFDFGTSVTVEDIDQVRHALGIRQWNIFGVSHGTTVAMTLMARYPIPFGRPCWTPSTRPIRCCRRGRRASPMRVKPFSRRALTTNPVALRFRTQRIPDARPRCNFSRRRYPCRFRPACTSRAIVGRLRLACSNSSLATVSTMPISTRVCCV